jgi:hypothetical protein
MAIAREIQLDECVLTARFCSKFFGAKGAAPKQQTKLSFATKASKKEVATEDVPEEPASTKDDQSEVENGN